MTPFVPRERVIPMGAWVTASVLAVLSFLIVSIVLTQTEAPLVARVIGPIVLPLVIGGYTLLCGYVYGDARRRGMRYVMWTLLAIFLTNGIGIILYFILRDPLPAYCSRCGGIVQQGFAYCPRCGANVLPACPACRRVVQPGWTHCAWCGANFAPAPARPTG
uniref:DZANK-type domain-containing protein n=1 Tax=Solibacter usitatus (strain Ellin6076) TaxID=234267 RepID=Q025K7_SOLUE